MTDKLQEVMRLTECVKVGEEAQKEFDKMTNESPFIGLKDKMSSGEEAKTRLNYLLGINTENLAKSLKVKGTREYKPRKTMEEWFRIAKNEVLSTTEWTNQSALKKGLGCSHGKTRDIFFALQEQDNIEVKENGMCIKLKEVETQGVVNENQFEDLKNEEVDREKLE